MQGQGNSVKFRKIHATEIGAEYWERTAAGELPIMQCDTCGKRRMYLTRVCPACYSTEYTWRKSSGRGTIYAATEVFYSPSDEFEAPYVLALVDLDDGVRTMANVLGATYADVPIGTRVVLTFERLSDGKMLPQFALERDAA